jgi:hypothetical protein
VYKGFVEYLADNDGINGGQVGKVVQGKGLDHHLVIERKHGFFVRNAVLYLQPGPSTRQHTQRARKLHSSHELEKQLRHGATQTMTNKDREQYLFLMMEMVSPVVTCMVMVVPSGVTI